MAVQVFSFAQVPDDHSRNLIYEEIQKGRSRFGMFDQAHKSLEVEYYGRNRLLLEIHRGDWIVHINMPQYGKCVAVQVAGRYQFDDGIECPWGTDFNNLIPNDPATILEFDRSDINVLPSVNLSPLKRIQRVRQVADFLESLENLRHNKIRSASAEPRSSIHLKNRLLRLLPQITEAIHEMNKSKEFERFLDRIFGSLPNTKSTPNGFGWKTDHGADLLVEFGNPVFGIELTTTLVVQAKSYEGNHCELNAVDQIVEGITCFDADGGLLITTGNKTEQLETYIREQSEKVDKPIYLIAGTEVAEFVLRYAPEMLFSLAR
ncbi:MAG: restriction endonuclease [Phycisphaerae bacterium]|jgi:hypothetical protein